MLPMTEVVEYVSRPNASPADTQFQTTLTGNEKALKAWRLRCSGLTWERIAQELGYSSRATAYTAAQQGRKLLPDESVEEVRAIMLARATDRYSRLQAIADAPHPLVSHGRVMYGDDGQPLEDSAAVVQALAAMRAEDAEVRKLLGLDAATRISVEHNKYTEEIAVLLGELVGQVDADE